MTYRDLGPDDVLQSGDRMRRDAICCRFHRIPDRLIGRRVDSIGDGEYTFRRKLTPAEITAAERVRFEAAMLELFIQWSPTGFHRMKNGEYADQSKQDKWKVWCSAVGCDPMGDV